MQTRSQDLTPVQSARARRKWRERGIAYGLSVGAHVAALLAFIMMHDASPVFVEPPVINVSLAEGPPKLDKAAPKMAPKKAVKPKPVKAAPKKIVTRPPLQPKLTRISLPAGDGDDKVPSNELSEAEIAGARLAGDGGQGGGKACDMVHRLQSALRRDGRAQQIMGGANRGKAILVWNGDWVVHPGQEGKGLAGLRELMLVEIGFAPDICRAEPMKGLVVISMADNPGAARIAFGTGAWRWGDMTKVH